MKFHKKFAFKTTFRILLILGNMVVLSIIFGDERLFFNQIILSAILILQILELLRFVNKTNKELAKFILAIKHSDFSINFNQHRVGDSFDLLAESFESIIDQYKKAKIEKEAQFQYLRTVVSHINIGIISIENDADITLMNTTAEQLLGVSGIKNWNILKEKVPVFTQQVTELFPEGQRLIELRSKDHATLSVDVSSVILLEQQYKLITLKDIKNEIEQKEIEAWHKLIRILTHEIMNSATPISSLTETMQGMLDKGTPNEETINDLKFSLKTIQRRSDGMLGFIDDYRKITRVPKPVLETKDIKELVDEIVTLTKGELKANDIELKLQVESHQISIDSKLIEQVLINLIKNAQQALAGRSDGKITIRSERAENNIHLNISDNGPGISEKVLPEIFIPFYTTKKQGSGIGLSLSKQIMHHHGGTISVDSEPQRGTTFTLKFKK